MESADTPSPGFIGLLRRRLGENSLARNALALISGTVVSQAIVFAASPLLSRIFGLADFGNFANYSAWVTVLALIASLRYEHAIIVARGESGTNEVLALTLTLSAIMIGVYTVAAAGIALLYTGSGYLAQIRPFVLLIPLGVAGVCFLSPLTQVNIKRGEFRRLAINTTIQVITIAAGQVVFGLLHVRHALIVGTIAGTFVAGVLIWLATFDAESIRRIASEVVPRRLYGTAVEHLNFPRYTLTADAIGVVVQQFIPVFILGLFNPAASGLYAFSVRVVRVPLIVVATAASSALRKEGLDHLDNEDGLARVFGATVKALVCVAAIPFLIILFFGPPMFAFVFGTKWMEAGRIVQILSPGIACEFVAFPLGAIFLLTGNQRYTFWTQLTGFLGLVAALACGRYYFHDFIATCYLVSGAMVAVNLAVIFFARVVSHRRDAYIVPVLS